MNFMFWSVAAFDVALVLLLAAGIALHRADASRTAEVGTLVFVTLPCMPMGLAALLYLAH